jgi:acetyl esterase/lipase
VNATAPRTLASIACLFFSGVLGIAFAQEASPETLKRLLERFPAADANKDGKLTVEEARAYRAKLSGKSDAGADAAKAGANQPVADAQKAARAAKKAKRAAGQEIKPDRADLSYGPHANNKLDLWLAKSDRPTPLMVFIHGGGFVGGDKSSASAVAIKQCLDAGVSFASINYRFRTEVPINTVLRDSARAIQFLRYKADEFHFDKTSVAAFGGSAGAGASLWLAFHNDLADAQADDPVLRESTRLVAAASSAGQATYDILRWRDVLGSDEAMRFYPQDTWPAFYGLTTLDEVRGPRGKELRADVDMLGLITADDPPVWLGASDRHDALENKGDTNHSPKHSEAIKKRCDEVGVPCVLKIGNAAAGDGEQTPVGFLLKHVRPVRR